MKIMKSEAVQLTLYFLPIFPTYLANLFEESWVKAKQHRPLLHLRIGLSIRVPDWLQCINMVVSDKTIRDV